MVRHFDVEAAQNVAQHASPIGECSGNARLRHGPVATASPCRAKVLLVCRMVVAAAKSYLIDMDGVLVSGRVPIPGAREFLARLEAKKLKYLLLTNNPIYTPGDLSYRLGQMGIQDRKSVV